MVTRASSASSRFRHSLLKHLFGPAAYFGVLRAPGARNFWAAHLVPVWDEGLLGRIPQEAVPGRPADTISVPLASEQPEKAGARRAGWPRVHSSQSAGALGGPQRGGSAAEPQPSVAGRPPGRSPLQPKHAAGMSVRSPLSGASAFGLRDPVT